MTVQTLLEEPEEPVLDELQLTEPFDEYFVSTVPLALLRQLEPELLPLILLMLVVVGTLNPRLLKKLLQLIALLFCKATTPIIDTKTMPITASKRLLFLPLL